jgi:hypothetical protein
MIAFETFKIISNNGFSIEEKDSTNKIFNAYNNEINFSYKDLMSPQDSFIEPAIFICIDNEFYYPAEKILKKIFAHNDFLSEKIEDFDAHHEKPFLGRVKIFGINHIFLQEEKA